MRCVVNDVKCRVAQKLVGASSNSETVGLLLFDES